jgi:DNA-binding NtrC family response regulator
MHAQPASEPAEPAPRSSRPSQSGTPEAGRGSVPAEAPGAVAIVDDDAFSRRMLRLQLTQAGFQVLEFETAGALLERGTEGIAVACVDLGLDDMDGLDLIAHLRARDADVAIVVVTGRRDLETAVRAMQAGAYDFITKPFEPDRVNPAVGRARERWELTHRLRRLERAMGDAEMLPALVGTSAAMRELVRQVDRVVESDVTVCLFGESGSGKEVVARAIHEKSARRSAPFVALNCAAIPSTLQESELFGHERGAFTGAVQSHRGRFEQASGGTLFLDELGEMSLSTQASLLRALQERSIRRVGGTAEIAVDVRIVCATHRDLRSEVEAGRFREDLYSRLVVYPIQLPPLRARLDDLPNLVAHFMKKLGPDVRHAVRGFSPEALEALARYAWPGNVRELQNVVHRCMLAADGEHVRFADLPADVQAAVLPKLAPRKAPAVVEVAPEASSARTPLLAEDEVIPLVELERRAIQHALRAAKGSIGRAAKLLGIGRATLYRRLASLDIPFEEGGT